MVPWISKWICPSWMVISWKPPPFGNDYNSTICCVKARILYKVELRTVHLNLEKKYENKGGKTIGLTCPMTLPIHHTEKVVVMDSGFCVLDGLLELKIVGVFGLMIVKKLEYWPRLPSLSQVFMENFKFKTCASRLLDGTLQSTSTIN